MAGLGVARRDAKDRDHLRLVSLRVNDVGTRAAAEPAGAFVVAYEHSGVVSPVAVFDPNQLAFLESVVGLAHGLRLAAIAKVIEPSGSTCFRLARAWRTRLARTPRLRRLPGDQTRSPPVRHKAERPPDQHEQPILEADQIPEVYDEPGDPRHEAAQMQALDVCHGAGATDGGKVALVPVVEGAGVAVVQAGGNDLRDVAALLH